MQRWLYPIFILIFLGGALSAAAILRTRQAEESASATIPPASLVTSLSGPLPNPETEKYAVYSALIRDMYLKASIRLLVIQHADDCPPSNDEASDEKVEDMRRQMDEYAIKELPELQSQTIDDFHAKAKQCFPFRKELDIPMKYTLVSAKDLESLFPQGEFDRAWTRFYSKYPNSSGIISFSNIGFNVEMNQALVSTGKACGGLCGAGHYVLLAKEHGEWHVKSKTMTWIS
jgi:hypothetical protein